MVLELLHRPLRVHLLFAHPTSKTRARAHTHTPILNTHTNIHTRPDLHNGSPILGPKLLHRTLQLCLLRRIPSLPHPLLSLSPPTHTPTAYRSNGTRGRVCESRYAPSVDTCPSSDSAPAFGAGPKRRGVGGRGYGGLRSAGGLVAAEALALCCILACSILWGLG
jgi:hypothetical protein